MRVNGLVMIMAAGCVFGPGLTACVVVPFPVVPEEDIFAEEKIQTIEPGITTRARVQEQFGEAALTRMDGKLAIYGQSRTVAGVFAGTLVGTGGVAPIEKFSTLVVQYDDGDIVRRRDILRGRNSCTEDGLCIEARFDWYDTGRLMEHKSELTKAVILSSGVEVDLPTQFDTTAGDCRIYLYSTGPDQFLLVSVAMGDKTDVTRSGYLVWVGEPGPVAIRAWRRDDWSETEIDCVPDGRHFINLHLKSRSGYEPPEILPVDDADGKAVIATRSIILH